MKLETKLDEGPQTLRTWERPRQGFLKLNVNKACDSELRRAAVGGVARNHDGEVVGVLAMVIEEVDSTQT